MTSLPKPNPSPPLPRIACFHGGGSNSLVFASQCKRLLHLLAHEYEFVFFDAPFEREAGPGVLPYFQDLAPFRTWMKPEFLAADESDVLEHVLQLMADDTRRRQSPKDRDTRDGASHAEGRQVGKWIGAMGFSQGTRVVGGLLRWMEHAAPRRDRDAYPDMDIQFGVLCMGSAKPMGFHAFRTLSTRSSSRYPSPSSSVYSLPQESPSNSSNDSSSDSCSDSESDTAAPVYNAIRIPTLHLHGLRDTILPRSREQLALYYDAERSSLLEINYHHAMPWYTHDLMEFVDLFRRTHAMAVENVRV